MAWVSYGALIHENIQSQPLFPELPDIHPDYLLCLYSTHLYFSLTMFHLPSLVERPSLLPVVFEVELILLSEVFTPPPVIFIFRLQSATPLCFCIWANKEGCFSGVAFHMALFRNEPAMGKEDHLFKYNPVNQFLCFSFLFLHSFSWDEPPAPLRKDGTPGTLDRTVPMGICVTRKAILSSSKTVIADFSCESFHSWPCLHFHGSEDRVLA